MKHLHEVKNCSFRRYTFANIDHDVRKQKLGQLSLHVRMKKSVQYKEKKKVLM